MENLSSFGLILASAITLIYLAHSKIMMAKVPQSVPWAGLRKEIFSKTRANFREPTVGLRTFKTGYNQVFDSILPTLSLLIARIYSSIKSVSLGWYRILGFVPSLWCLKNT